MNSIYSPKTLFSLVSILALLPGVAFATGSSDMGSGGFSQITTSAANIVSFLQGPIATSVIVLAIIICGGMWFLNRQGQNAQNLGRIAIGAILIFLAPQVLSILGLGGAGI